MQISDKQKKNLTKGYINLIEKRLDEEDYVGALNSLYSLEESLEKYEYYQKKAQIYSYMGALELSNKYWFKYVKFAPKDKVSVAYEELAINFFYLDNLWASGYYFHKKLSVDGFISTAGLDQEILDFFSGEEKAKNRYKLVYPYELANYEEEHKIAKKAIGTGDFRGGINVLSKIPSKCRNEDMSSDLAIAYIMDEQPENAKEECARIIEERGESLSAYCNLSTAYSMLEDEEKAKYYYNKALSLRKGDEGESFKLITCAIEQMDHEIIKECLSKILKDRPNESPMIFFYGINLLNLGDYDRGVQAFKRAVMIDDKDQVYRYYYELAKSLRENVRGSQKFLPLKYVKEIPSKQTAIWEKQIKKLANSSEQISREVKKKEIKDLLRWGLTAGNEEIMRYSAYLLTFTPKREQTEVFFDILIDPEYNESVKSLCVYALIVNGYKGKLSIVAGNYYLEAKVKTLKCEKLPDGDKCLVGYAYLMSKIVFYNVEDFGKTALGADKVYYKLKGKIDLADISNEEMAGLILLESGYKKYSNDIAVLKLFDLDKKKFEKLKEILKDSKW